MSFLVIICTFLLTFANAMSAFLNKIGPRSAFSTMKLEQSLINTKFESRKVASSQSKIEASAKGGKLGTNNKKETKINRDKNSYFLDKLDFQKGLFVIVITYQFNHF